MAGRGQGGTRRAGGALALAALLAGAFALALALALLPHELRMEVLVGAGVAGVVALAFATLVPGREEGGDEPREASAVAAEAACAPDGADVPDAPAGAGARDDGPAALPATGDDVPEGEGDGDEAGDEVAHHGPLARPSELVDSLAQVADPIEALSPLVSQASASGPEATFARWLSEAGVGEEPGEGVPGWPRTRLVRLRRTSLAYLRIEEPEVSYLARRRVLAVESALNRMLLVEALAGDGLDEDGEGELYRLAQGIDDSVCAQAAPLGWAIGRRGGREGEWVVRSVVATQLEGWRLPHRLEATFRCSVLNGEAAFEVRLPDPETFPRSRWSRDLGRVIPTTALMRERAASAYALRLGILLAAGAFEASGHIRRVHVAGVRDTARHHLCLYSVCFDADRFRMLVDLSEVSDPASTYRSFGARMHLTHGTLDPVDQGFSLEEDRFCPRRRYAAPEGSRRVLPTAEGRMLGTATVAGLGRDGGARLRLLGDELARRLGDSCERNVRALMDVARREGDEAVGEAAARTARRLVEGSVECDPAAVVEEFVAGDDLSRGVRRAFAELARGQAGRAVSDLADLLAPVEVSGAYEDDGDVAWRSFRSYAERALYNRLEAADGERCELVPPAYYDAHLLLASALLERGHADAALGEARLVSRLDPLDERARLRAVRALELKGDVDGAIQELGELLERAFTPEGVAVGYYRLAFMLWQSGDPEGADACYRRSLRFPSEMALSAAAELTALDATNPALLLEGAPDDEEVDRRLAERGIPLAPVGRVTDALLECTAAAVDVEVFPVAKSLAVALARLSGDDAAFALADSIEGEPDD